MSTNHGPSFLLLLALIVYGFNANAQKLDDSKEGVEDPSNTICTTWEPFYQSAGWKGVFRILEVAEEPELEIKVYYTSGEEIFIDEGQTMTLIFANEKEIILTALKDGKTCEGCGSEGMMGRNKPGVNAHYKLHKEELEALARNDVYTIKIELRTGSLTVDLQGIKSMFSKNIRQAAELLAAP